MTTRNVPCTLVGCGCETTVYVDVGVEIHYCPIHAAAPELLEALSIIASIEANRQPDTATWKDIASEAIDTARAAIAKCRNVSEGN